MRQPMAACTLLTAVVCLFTTLPVLAAELQRGLADKTVMEEVVVLGKRPGPPLWKVYHGDHVLWIFGTTSPLLKKMQWDSESVEFILSESQELLLPPMYSASLSNPFRLIGVMRKFNRLKKLPDKQEYSAVLTATTLQHIAAVESRYGIDVLGLERLRPLFLGDELTGRAYQSVDLVDDQKITKRIRKLAKKNKLRITESIGAFSIDEALLLLSEMTAEAEQACLDATLKTLNADVHKARQKAAAWADGDKTFDPANYLRREACSNVLAQTPSAKHTFVATEERWIAQAMLALENNPSSFAYLAISEIVSPDGLVARLQARLAQVETDL